MQVVGSKENHHRTQDKVSHLSIIGKNKYTEFKATNNHFLQLSPNMPRDYKDAVLREQRKIDKANRKAISAGKKAERTKSYQKAKTITVSGGKLSLNHDSYKPIRLHLKRSHIKTLAEDGGILLRPERHVPIYSGCPKKTGGQITYLHMDNIQKMHKSLQSGKGFRLRMSPEHIAYNVRHAAGLWDEMAGGGIVQDTINRVSGEGGDASQITDAIKHMIDTLPEELRKAYHEPILHDGDKPNSFQFFTMLVKGAPKQYEQWSEQQRKLGIIPSEELYRLQRLEAWSEHKSRQDNRYSGFVGFLRGAIDAVVAQAPLSLAQVANMLGEVVPGAKKVTDKIEEKLNPDNAPLPIELVGGLAEKAYNLSVQAASKISGGGLKKKAKNRMTSKVRE